jgi:hypothetical protein
MRDASDLDAGTIVLEAIAQLAFDRAVVALLVHIDEVDDDQAGKVAQAELTGDFFSRLEVGLECGVFDVVLAGRTAGVHVDRNQGFGLVDDDIAAGTKLHGWREHRIKLMLDAHAREQRLAFAIGLHGPCRARHQHLHEVAALPDSRCRRRR